MEVSNCELIRDLFKSNSTRPVISQTPKGGGGGGTPYNDLSGGSVAEWSARWTRNPAVPGSSPGALATCWIFSR